jgi:uncharacterized linocin/CFP29 family protein
MNLIANAIGPDGRLNLNRLRPFIHQDGNTYIANNGTLVRTNAPATLRYDEWKDIDRRVIDVATERLVGIADLISCGLTHNLGSVGLTTSQWDRSSDMTEAQISMSGITTGENDAMVFESQAVPVPIIHKDFELNWRRLEASRRFGTSLDVAQGAIAARVVAEKSEDMLFGGASIQVDGNTIYGYTTHPHRNTVTLSEQWTAVGKTGAEILADVQAMLAAARADNMHGPFTLYVPGEYETRLDDDYNPATSDTRTIRQRIMQLNGIQDIKVADRLTNHNVLLVQLDSNVVDLAIAQDINTVQWDAKGGLQSMFKVMAIWVPRIKSDYDGKSGIVHLSA